MDEMRYQLDLLKAINHKLSGHEKMYRLICDTSDETFLYCTFDQNEVSTIGQWNNYFDFQIREVKDFPLLFDEVLNEYVLQLRDVLFLEKMKQTKKDVECRLKDGRTWLNFETHITYDELDMPTDKVIRIRNVTKLKAKNEELRYMAYYDSLTGLYNRNYFIQLLGEYVQQAEKANNIVSVLFIDIDDFRKINDGFGLLVGDEVIQQFGQFLGEFTDEQTIVCHINNDIFCIAIYDPCGSRSVEHVYRIIQEKARQGFALSTGQELTLSVTIGVAEYPEASRKTLELIKCAEIVMFKAKEKGKSAIQYFDAPILQDFERNVELEAKLKDAAIANDFVMYFQPQYRTSNKRLRGVEALIRWPYEDKMISPSTFIPLAEKNGSIVSIGSWVIAESLRCFVQWKERYHDPMILSINISAVQYKRKDFVRHLMDLVQKYQIRPEEVELEITESVLIEDFDEVKEKLHVLRDYGFRISLDDFGTGFSSLSYLRGLPVDTLKIDKSFIDALTTDPSSRIITESILAMIHKLGYESVAEGVEDKEQYEYLKNNGCDVIQGYLLGKPMTAQEIDRLLMQLL